MGVVPRPHRFVRSNAGFAAGLSALALRSYDGPREGPAAPVQPGREFFGATAIVNGFFISNYDLDQRIAFSLPPPGAPDDRHSSANPRSVFALA